ncbi:hypothetical protein [Vibrio bivalvicida]|uniref:AAA+ ATPase domain-containing protein n=1 Tax=Vibrio bivalvicida TaxID=1276888 RepID=A0ABV4MMD5_9VIBR
MLNEQGQPAVIDTNDVLSLLDNVEMADVIEAGIKSMPFQSLTPDHFELLLWDLFYSRCNEPEIKFDRARLMLTGADQGRDVWLTQKGKPSGLVQCKREVKKYSCNDVIKEVLKFLIHSELNSALLPEPESFTYCLALSTDPKGEVDEFFENPLDWFSRNKTQVEVATESVIRNYQTFRTINSKAINDSLFIKLNKLNYQLIRPHELNRWLDVNPTVRKRFFKLPDDGQIIAHGYNVGNPLDAECLKVASYPLCNWQKTIENRFIERPELDVLERKLQSEESNCFLLTGVAGSGKSSLLSSLYERLSDTQSIVLAIKADELSKDINDLDDLAAFLKFESHRGLVSSLLDLSRSSRLVVIIDQMDAVSEVMDQSSSRFRVLIDLILELKRHFEVREEFPIYIVASSRPFEASFDARFTQLEAEEIELSSLSKDDVELFLEQIGIDKTAVPAPMYPTIQVPFALSLYVNLVKTGDDPAEITSKNLLSRWRDKKLSDPLLKEQSDSFLMRLAADMVRDEVLTRPVSAYSHADQSLISKLESMGILVRHGCTIGFSHQAWLDDYQSQSFLCGDDDFYKFVLDKQNGLFSRSTILRGLEYLREHDKSVYHRTLDQLLFDQSVRRHIYHLLIDVMTSTSSPDYEDAERVFKVIGSDASLASRVILKTSKKWGLWRDFLLDELPSLMRTAEHSRDAVLWLIPEITFDETHVISLMTRHWMEAAYHEDSFNVLLRSGASSRGAIDLAESIISSKSVDKYSCTNYIEGLFKASQLDAAFRLLTRWLLVEREDVLWDRSLSIDCYVDANPLQFVEVLFPWYIELLEEGEVQKEVSRTFRRSASLSGEFDEIANSDGMISILLKALIRLANDEPKQYVVTVNKYSHIDFDEVQSLLVLAFASNPTALATQVLDYLIENEARFCIGHGCFKDDQNVMHFVNGNLTMMLLEEVSPHWSLSQSELIRDAIEGYQLHKACVDFDVETRRYLLGCNEKYRLSLLARLPSQILSPRKKRQISERDTSNELKVGQRCKGIGMASFVGSPMSSEQMKLATAEDTMNLLDELSDPSVDPLRRWRRWGGAELTEFSRAFCQFATVEPQRAISMLRMHFVKGTHEQVAGDAIAELASSSSLTAKEVKDLVSDLNAKGFSSEDWVRGVSRALEEVARKNKGLEQLEIDLLVDYLGAHTDIALKIEDEYERETDGALLFGRHSGLSVRSSCSSSILAAVYMGLLARDKPDYDQWVDILLNFAETSKSESAWNYILQIQGKWLFWADRVKVNNLIDMLIETMPSLFRSPSMVHTFWDLSERLNEEVLMKLLLRWISSDSEACKQAAAELMSGLVISNRATESIATLWESTLRTGETAFRKGGIFAAASGWYVPDGNIRSNAHTLLMSCIQDEGVPVASAFNSLFPYNSRLPQDDLTLQLLIFLSEMPDFVRQLDAHNLLAALVNVNPRPRALQPILLIVKTIIEIKLEGGRRTYIQDAEQLIELTVTLQRSSSATKAQAMSLYEMLLDAGSYQAEQAAEVASRS